jgi:PncC family amidohydrolase
MESPDAVRRTAAILSRSGHTISVCESCTGGLLSAWLTVLAGSSRYFAGGIVAYADDIKLRVVRVRPSTLRRFGAVSPQTARQMAVNVRSIFKTDLGLAVTGIAGPAGGTRQKPVGTAHIALASSRRTVIRSFRFSGSRSLIRQRSCSAALGLLHDFLRKEK